MAQINPMKKSCSSRADTDRYVSALESKLRELGLDDAALGALKAAATEAEAAPLEEERSFGKVFERRIAAMKARPQDPMFTIPVEVRLRKVDFSQLVEVGAEPQLRTVLNANPVGKAAARAARAARPPEKVEKHMLHDVSARFRPGSLTLVLGPPQSGKTSLLRLCAGLLRPAGSSRLVADEVSFNGDPVYPKVTGGDKKFEPTKVAAYIDEIDRHSPSLTVEETLRFAFQTLGAGRLMAPPDDSEVREEAKRFMPEGAPAEDAKLDFVLKALGIDHVRDTVVGNASVRGVSGGQRRRVTVGEMLMGTARVILGDEISTGLDSQTTFEMARGFRMFGDTFGLTVVLSLLQPPPEVFKLFDDVLLLWDGRAVYHGPTKNVVDHLAAVGYAMPKRKDVSDYLIEVCSPVGREYASTEAPATPEALEAAWRATPAYEAAEARLAEAPADLGAWPEAFATRFELGFSTYAFWCFRRRMKEIRGDPSYYRARACQSIFMAIFTGSLYFQTNYDDFQNKLGVFFVALMYIGLGAVSEVPGNIADRDILYKHSDASFYPPLAFALSRVFFNVPWIITESFIYCNLLYWLVGLTSSGFVGFFCTTALLGLAMSSIFNCLSLVAPNASVATPLAGLCVLFCVLFSGFVVQRPAIPNYWIWVYWMSPVAWAFRSATVNEFTQDLYEGKQTFQKNSVCAAPGSTCPFSSDGHFFLDAYGIQTERYWFYYGLMVLGGYFLGFFALYVYFAARLRHNPAPAVGLSEYDAKPEIKKTMSPAEAIAARSSSETAIPYEPVTLAFRDVRYTVMVPPKQKRGEPYALPLLQGVTGFSRPATLTALMGSSGAGKTTLLDVVAGRKTGGVVEGDITVNGHPKEQRTFTRISGYVEQLDVHSPESTVYEATLFSATLRLEPEHAPATKKFVDTILAGLELDGIRDRQIGEIGKGDALSFEQRKRLTMAVELAANPAILFLDEPTSGLDSRSAIVVARAVQAISSTGRSVICTIHQPSYALFSIFDRLLLLKKGGRTVYFGDLGDDCHALTSYLSRACDDLATRHMTSELKDGANPATWMLSACVAPEDFSAYYEVSELAAENDRLTEEAMVRAPGSEPVHFATTYALPFWRQVGELTKRQVTNYFRSPSYNVTRGVVTVLVSLIFGTTFLKRRPAAVKDFSNAFSRCGMMYLDVFFMGIIFYSSAIPNFIAQRDSYYREHASRMYAALPYAITFGLAEFPYLVLYTLLHVGILWGLVDFFPHNNAFGYYCLYFFLFISLLTYMAQALAAAMPNQQVASSLGMAYLAITANVSGFAITPDLIPGFWKFMYWLAPIHYVFEGLVVTQYHDAELRVEDVPGMMTDPTLSRYFASHWEDSHFGGLFAWSHRWQNVLVLCGFIVFFRIMTFWALYSINYKTT